MENIIKKNIDITPFIESFSFFEMDNNINNEYNKICANDQNQQNLSDYINEIKNNSILNDNTLKNEPQKAFIHFLNILHQKLKENKTKENKIKSAEINKENARNLFYEFKESDKSYISENFFGIKSIEKNCKTCHMTQYIYKYIKAIQITISDINEENVIDFDKCLKKLDNSKFDREDFCPICSSNQKHEICLNIEEYPKNIIFILPEEKYTNFHFRKYLREREYKLIGAELKDPKGILDIFKCKCFQNKYQFFGEDQIHKKGALSGLIPLVLIYQKNKDNKEKCNSSEKQNSSKDFVFEKDNRKDKYGYDDLVFSDDS